MCRAVSDDTLSSMNYEATQRLTLPSKEPAVAFSVAMSGKLSNALRMRNVLYVE